MRRATLVPLLLALAFTANPLSADEPRVTAQTLFAGSETVLGQPLAYPEGQAVVTAQLITLAPGAETGWHLHAVPLYAYILEGELTVDYGERGTHVYRAGDSVLEAMDWPHNGHNAGSAPVRLLAVYMGAKGVADATKLPAE